MLQIAYAESMAMLLTAIVLLLLVRRRYAWVFPVVLRARADAPERPGVRGGDGALLSSTASSGAAKEPFPRADAVPAVALTVWGLVVGFAWPAVAWAVTGSLTAYTDTELAWRSSYIGYQRAVPFTSWFQGGAWWGGWWFGAPMVGIALVVVLVLLFVGVLASPWTRRLDIFSRMWVARLRASTSSRSSSRSRARSACCADVPAGRSAGASRDRPLFRSALVLVSIARQIGWIHRLGRRRLRLDAAVMRVPPGAHAPAEASERQSRERVFRASSSCASSLC